MGTCDTLVQRELRVHAPTKSSPRPKLGVRGPRQAGALALLGQYIYYWSFGVWSNGLVSVADWLLHHEPATDEPAVKPGRSGLRRTSSRTQLAGV